VDVERLNGFPVSSGRRFSKQNGSAVRVAVVGLGYWGPNLLRALFELENVEVRYICDLDPERLERFGRRYPSARATRDYENVLADRLVDAVVIATPVFTHFALASRALAAGKHVFVEKPLCIKPDELRAIAGCVESLGARSEPLTA